MKPGEVITKNEEIDLNKVSNVTKIKISNSGETEPDPQAL